MIPTLNEVTLRGRVGAPTGRLSASEAAFASVDLELSDTPKVTITVVGTAMEAVTLGAMRPGEILKVEGSLAYDPHAREFYVSCDTATRLEVRDGALQAKPPELSELSRLTEPFVKALA